MRAARLWGRLAARLLTTIAVLAVLVLIGVQFARVAQMDLDLARRVAAARTERERLIAQNARMRASIRRLQTPQGAVPAIHEELHLVRPHEEIIYLEGDGSGGG